MSLQTYCDQLADEINKAIATLEADALSPQRLKVFLSMIEGKIAGLKRFVDDYAFETLDEEIHFFKFIKPGFVSKLIFYGKVLEILTVRKYESEERFVEYCSAQLINVRGWLSKHHIFYRYYLTETTQHDDKFFTRRRTPGKLCQYDMKFSSSKDLLVAKIIGSEMLVDFLLSIKAGKGEPEKHLTWAASKTDAIELIYALHALKVFRYNHGLADVKQIAVTFEQTFNVELGNFYRAFQDVRLRKKTTTKFLDLLKDSLEKKIEQGDI